MNEEWTPEILWLMAREWREDRQRVADEVARLRNGEVPPPPEETTKRVSDIELFSMMGIASA